MSSDKRQIVDAHHHLWDLSGLDYPWLMARGVTRFFGDPTPIQKNYLVSDFRDDARDYDLQASVHIQVGVAQSDELGESKWLQQCADEYGLPVAAVAYCDLSRHDAVALLTKHKEYPIVRGIRQIVGRSDAEDAQTGSGGLLADKTWQHNLQALADLDLSFDLQMIPRQVPAVVELLRSMPELRVALCHCGSPWDQTEAGLAAWKDGLLALAELPNVYCKMSGLGMFDHNWSVESIRPIVESCIEVFGTQRCMFASNFPVDKLHRNYAAVWSAFEEIAMQFNDADQQLLFAGTAAGFYSIDL